MTNTNRLEGMICPACGSNGPFKIDAGVWLLFHDDGSADYQYDDVKLTGNEACFCPACGYSGTVADFRSFFTGAETYRCLALSTAHIEAFTNHCLSLGLGSNMVMERDTGYFIKLYEVDDYKEHPAPWAKNCPELYTLLGQAYAAGFRLVELDCDADTVATLPTFDW